MPTACAACAQVAMTRDEPNATCVAEIMRPARNKLLTLREYKTAIRNAIQAAPVPLIAAGLLGEDAVRRMQVN